MMTNQKKDGTEFTTWEVCTYDVWRNARDGYDVNNVYHSGEVELSIPRVRYNVGTSQEFVSAFPTDRQIKRVFGETARIDVEGDDLNVYVTRQRDGYPLGEMRCTSHRSLSPVRPHVDVVLP